MKKRKNLILLFMTLIATNLFAQPLAEGQDKFLGNILGSELYRNFDDYWTQVTPENAGKWGSVEWGQDSYDWSELDLINTFAKKYGLTFKNHTLIWGSQQPGWISSLDSAEQREEIEEWMQLVGERYPNMSMVDVVNEPLHSQPDYKDALGGDGETGWDWVITSFELARQYMPDTTELILNDYNIFGSSQNTNQYLKIINLLNDRGLIDAIGVQGHYFEFVGDGYSYEVSTIKSNLDRLAEVGLPIYITEFDINEEDDDAQLESMKTYFPIFWEHSSVKGMTFWGFVEGDMWKENAWLISYPDYDERPALEWLREYINTPQPPQSPVLVSPVAADDVSLTPTFVWKPSENADSYHLQIAKKSTFKSIVVDTTVTDTFYVSDELELNTVYYWHVSAINENGEGDYSDRAAFVTIYETAIDKDMETADQYTLAQNYPNPFNPTTTISFEVAKRSSVKLTVFDMLGNKVAILANDNYDIGTYSAKFDASDLTSGVYFYQLQAGDFISTKKMILMK